MKPLKIFTLSLALFAGTLHASSDTLLANDSLIGTVKGEAVTLSDIETKQINDLRIQLHDALQEAYIKHAIQQLANQSPDYTLPPPVVASDEDIKSFYLNNQLQARGPLEQMAPLIRDYLEGMANARNHIQIYQQALLNGDLTSRLEKPEEMLLKLPVESAYIRGNPKARIMVMEFSDYQCPFCKRAQSTVKALIEQYGDRVAFGYRHYPLAFHQEADDAALAIECAKDQGVFEAMHDIFFQQPSNLGRDELKSIAERVGIKNLEKFNTCLDSDQYVDRLARDKEVAESVGITGTPGFIVGYHNPIDGTLEGELLSGAQPMNIFVSTIEKYLTDR